ncbi:16S rRNA (guanine(527)-N(7))-methyltransferase RsmG [Olsenella profusa]|nr:16S rRNA (guanine(527)-N(7))-methyltransferase RsmG [Olsenella profusa]
MHDALIAQLVEELAVFGIRCKKEQAELMVRHLELLIEKNKVVNLTRITEPADAVTLHLVDSLLPLASREVSVSEKDRYLDLGTGGGFPGIPFGVMTGSHGTLLDSVGKKVAAVNEFIQELGMRRLVAVHDRVEDYARTHGGSQTIVLARAVAQTNALVEYATPLLSHNGLLLVQKGRPETEEIERGVRAAKICGLELVSRETFELPRGLGHREVLVFKKVRKPTIKLPRKTGLAKREPLGE